MILLDENIPADQRQLLHRLGFRIRQIGIDVGHSGMSDGDIVSLLMKHRRATFFTRDDDFYKQGLCHPRFCLVFLSVHLSETAMFVRKVLRHREFDTEALRLGKVLRVTHVGISFWSVNAPSETRTDW